MLNPEINERLCRTGPGTPMGEVFRRYWIPALLSEELPEPDCPPVRVKLLGEELVAFRDTSGKVGIVERFCPHRRANLFFGRNEENGLRCVYHGWKFNVQGQCVDMPNEAPESKFKEKVRITTYPTYEKADVIWTYMGPESEKPPIPDYEWMRAPETHRFLSKTFESANYLQGIEGGVDTSHSSFAHNNNLQDKNALRTRAPAPKIEVIKQPYGFTYYSLRDLGDAGNYVRGYQFIMPFQQMRGWMTRWHDGGREKYPSVNGHIWVPIDDEHCWAYNWMYSADESTPLPDEYVKEHEQLFGRAPEDMLPGYRLKRNPSNDYLIDRDVQRTKTFTGIDGINTQDYALQETMEKPFPNRSQERLGASDAAVIATRRLLLEASREVEAGRPPRGIDPITYRHVRGGDHLYRNDVDWKEEIEKTLVACW